MRIVESLRTIGNTAVSPLPRTSWTSYAVHDEGDGLWALHVASLPALLLAELDARLDLDGQLFDMRETWGVSTPKPVSTKAILQLTAPCAILHAPDGSAPRRGHILADPQQALPLGSHRLLAMAFYDDNRAVLYTRNLDVLCTALICYVGGVIEDLAGQHQAPAIDKRSVQALLAPVPQGAWREVHLERGANSWICELRGYGAPTERWIGNVEAGWRTSWVW